MLSITILAFAYKQGFPLFTLSTLGLFAVLVRGAWQLPSADSRESFSRAHTEDFTAA